jgi:flagellar hook-associated protein 2
VTINTAIDSSGVEQMIKDYIDRYNDIMDYIDEQNTYNSETGESGVLFSDYSLQVMQNTLRSATTSKVSGLSSNINMLTSIGIRSDAYGRLSITNSGKLIDSIINNYENVIKLFTNSGESSSPYIQFLSASSETQAGEDYEVEITHAATKGYLQGGTINDPDSTPLTIDSANNKLKLKIDGIVSNELALSAKTYASGAELASEIQTRINADSKLGEMGISVEWVDIGSTGYFKITSGSYGSQSKVEMVTSIANTAYSILGMTSGISKTGIDVAGTINGEAATGSGQILTGNNGNETTEGLKLKITLTGADLVSGAEGAITVAKGMASEVDKALDKITKSTDGSIARRVSAINNQIENINDQIAEYEERLTLRKEELHKQFSAMETAMSEYQTMGSYLTTQLASIQKNWGN